LPNLATRVLALACQRLSPDWLARHGHPLVAVESFVDGQLFRGACYKAAGWTLLGETSGYGRSAEDFYVRHNRPKQLWVKVLDPAGWRGLKAEPLPPQLPFTLDPGETAAIALASQLRPMCCSWMKSAVARRHDTAVW